MSISSTSLMHKAGKPVVAKYTESGTHNAGDVVVVGATPFVAHVDVPQFTGGTLVDALACEGGIYTGVSDGTPKVGHDVYWNPAASKFTLTSAGNVHFGKCVAGPTGDLAGASPTTDADLVDVLHAPRGAAASGDVAGEATASATATLTAAQLLGGFINSAPGGAINLTLPTAANMVAGMKGCKVGDKFECSIENTSGGANSITLLAGGATLRGGATIAQNKSALLRVLITNVTAAAEAYTVHSIVGA
jgi:hypothetical protein